MQHRAKYHQTTIWCTKSVSFVPADCSGRSRQSGGFGVSKRRRRPGGSSGSVVSSGRRRCGERNGAGRPTGPWTCPSPDPSDAFYSRYHPSHWWRSTKTWLSSAARGASSSRPSCLSALLGRRGLNLVRGDPRPPGVHREGSPLVLLPLLSNDEGRGAAITALVVTATVLDGSINYFF